MSQRAPKASRQPEAKQHQLEGSGWRHPCDLNRSLVLRARQNRTSYHPQNPTTNIEQKTPWESFALTSPGWRKSKCASKGQYGKWVMEAISKGPCFLFSSSSLLQKLKQSREKIPNILWSKKPLIMLDLPPYTG